MFNDKNIPAKWVLLASFKRQYISGGIDILRGICLDIGYKWSTEGLILYVHTKLVHSSILHVNRKMTDETT